MPGLPVPDKYLRNYQSIPQNGLNGRTSIVYSAAVVGGGTVVNAMFFNRGSKADGIHGSIWAIQAGIGRVFFPTLRRFASRFVGIARPLTAIGAKATTFTPPTLEIADDYPISSDLSPHGTQGPIGASFPNFQFPIASKLA